MAEEVVAQDGLGSTVGNMTALLSANNSFLVSNRAERLQQMFDALTCIFDSVCHGTNVRKTISMI